MISCLLPERCPLFCLARLSHRPLAFSGAPCRCLYSFGYHEDITDCIRCQTCIYTPTDKDFDLNCSAVHAVCLLLTLPSIVKRTKTMQLFFLLMWWKKMNSKSVCLLINQYRRRTAQRDRRGVARVWPICVTNWAIKKRDVSAYR